MQKLLTLLLVISSFSIFANEDDFISKARLAIRYNNANLLENSEMTLLKAKESATILLEKYEQTDKSNAYDLQLVITEANNLWPLLGKDEAGVKAAVLEIKRHAMDDLDSLY